MNLRTVTFPASRQRSGARRGRASALVALAAALPMALGLVAPAPADAFTATSPTGIDVSKWQRPGGAKLNWEQVAASGEKFAFIKATDGKEGLSPYFAEDSKAAHDAGLIIGSYHKAHPDRDAIVQADAYAEALKLQPADARTLPPVLDIELDADMSPDALEKWTATFLQRVELKTGRTPMIYTYRWFWSVKMGDTSAFTGYPLWFAAYQNTPPTNLPGGWDEPLFWQRSSTGRVPGINTPVDLNTFNGTKAELDALAAGAAPEGAGTTRDDKSDAVRTGERRAETEDDTGVDADAVSPPSGRAAPGPGSLDTADVIGGDDATGTDSPVATSELVDAIIEAVKAGSANADFSESIAAVRDAADAAGLDQAQIDLLIAFLEQAIGSGNVPEDQLEEIGETAPTTDEAEEINDGKTDSREVVELATYSDVVALLAGATR